MPRINIAAEFGTELGARYRYEGDKSGQQFLEELLLPRFEQAVAKKEKLTIELDGVLGYPASFVSGAFGKLSLEKGATTVLDNLVFLSKNNLRVEKIVFEIKTPTIKPPQFATK